MRTALLGYGLLLLFSSVASAAGKLQPGDKHDPPLFADEGATWMNVVGGDASYRVKAAFRVVGAQNKNDRVRFDWKSGGKVIGAGKCRSDFAEKAHTLTADCEIDTQMTTVGPIDVDLVYADDQTDTEYLVTTFHVTARMWQSIGKVKNWGMLPDDALAVAYARFWHGEPSNQKALIEFWTTNGSLYGSSTLRCSVDGKKLPDFDAHFDRAQASTQHSISVTVTTPKEHREYLYEHVQVETDLRYGEKKTDGNYDPARLKWLIDDPGQWDCFLRKDGHTMREFLFTVNDKGTIEPSEMQKGSHAVPTMSNVVLIDMKIPADNGVEKRLRPDALKKSIGFGQPWPDGAKAKELQAAFPPASGLPD